MPKRVLMCLAEYFGVNFEINPWMHVEHQPSLAKALTQQQDLIQTLEKLGHQLEFLQPQPDCPDICFTANAAVVKGNKAFLSNLPPERQPEHPHHKAWFETHGFETTETSFRFGGGGDALWVGDTLLAGYGEPERRASDLEVHTELANFFGVEVVSLHAQDPRFYDLDMSVGILRPDLICYSPDALDHNSVNKLKKLKDVELIEVSLRDALGFGCNLQSDGNNVILPYRAPGLIKELERRGLNVFPLNINQFVFSGGGVRCLGLDLPPAD